MNIKKGCSNKEKYGSFLCGFDNWDVKLWDLYYDKNNNIGFKSRKRKSLFEIFCNIDIKMCLFILGRMDLNFNIAKYSDVTSNYHRINMEEVVKFLDCNEFLMFNLQREILQDLGYLYPSLVDVDFSVNSFKVNHYEIGVVTANGLEFLNFVRGKHYKINCLLFIVKKNFWRVGTLGSVASIVSLIMAIIGYI